MYLVIERIKLQESPPDLPARIQKAMKWLSEVPLSSTNHALVPVGGGCIYHKFFKEFKAPFVCPDVVTDGYMKRVRPYLYFPERPLPLTRTLDQAYSVLSVTAKQKVPPVNICCGRVMFTQSDME